MPKKIVIVGAVALGPKVACRLRRLDPEAEIIMLDRDPIISYGGCGIPYYISGDVQELDELTKTVYHAKRTPEFFKVYKQLEVRTRMDVQAIDRKNKKLTVRNMETDETYELDYDVLVLGTGATPFVPPMPGTDLPGVHPVANLHHAKQVRDAIAGGVKQAVVLGAGAIGLEMAEALADLWGIETSIVEMLPQILPQALGSEISGVIAKHLKDQGVAVRTGERVTEILGDAKTGVSGVRLASGEVLPAQMVIMSVGVRPQVELARAAGLAIGGRGGIVVDKRLRTSDPFIYAGGDCVEMPNLLSGENMHLPLGSLANRHGRVIGSNIAGMHDEFPGVVGTFIIKVFEFGVARSGLTEIQAKNAGYDPVAAVVIGADRAHFYPTQKLMFMKLIADRKTRKVLGIEACGQNGDAVKARVDAVAALLMHGGSVADVSNLEIGYAPPFASAMDIVNAAANALANVMDGINAPASPEEFAKLLAESDIKVLDVRAAEEAAPYKERWGDRWINIPQDCLCDQCDTLPDEPMLVYCNTGLRSFEAQRMLHARGLTQARNVQGGHGLQRMLRDNPIEPEAHKKG